MLETKCYWDWPKVSRKGVLGPRSLVQPSYIVAISNQVTPSHIVRPVVSERAVPGRG